MLDGGVFSDGSSDGSSDVDSGSGSDFDIATCPRRPTAGLSLFPREVFVFAGDTSCIVPPARFLLVNETGTHVVVTGLLAAAVGSARAQFAATTNIQLPRTLAPDEALSVSLALDSTELGGTEVSGEVVVRYDDGCDSLYVSGMVAEPGPIIAAPLAVDFGISAPASVGAPVPIRFSFPHVGNGQSRFLFSARSSYPAIDFELVSSVEDAMPNPCDSLTAEVRFNAPSLPGIVEGRLAWEMRNGDVSGFGEVALRGVVREP